MEESIVDWKQLAIYDKFFCIFIDINIIIVMLQSFVTSISYEPFFGTGPPIFFTSRRLGMCGLLLWGVVTCVLNHVHPAQRKPCNWVVLSWTWTFRGRWYYKLCSTTIIVRHNTWRWSHCTLDGWHMGLNLCTSVYQSNSRTNLDISRVYL